MGIKFTLNSIDIKHTVNIFEGWKLNANAVDDENFIYPLK